MKKLVVLGSLVPLLLIHLALLDLVQGGGGFSNSNLLVALHSQICEGNVWAVAYLLPEIVSPIELERAFQLAIECSQPDILKLMVETSQFGYGELGLLFFRYLFLDISQWKLFFAMSPLLFQLICLSFISIVVLIVMGLKATFRTKTDWQRILVLKLGFAVSLFDLPGELETLLEISINRGQPEVLKFLLSKAVDFKESLLLSKLWLKACSKNPVNLQVVQALWEQLQELIPNWSGEVKDETGRSVLHLAVENEQFELMQFLLEKEPINSLKWLRTRDINGFTPCFRAAQMFSYRGLKLLIDFIDDELESIEHLDEEDFIGAPPSSNLNLFLQAILVPASNISDLDDDYQSLLALCYRKSALTDYDEKAPTSKETAKPNPLMLAFQLGNLSAASWILTNVPANTNFLSTLPRDSNGYTIPMQLVLRGDVKALEILLDRKHQHFELGIDSGTRDESITALMMACGDSLRNISVSIKMVQLLLDRGGANLNLCDKFGWNALFYAVNNPNGGPLVKYILERVILPEPEKAASSSEQHHHHFDPMPFNLFHVDRSEGWNFLHHSVSNSLMLRLIFETLESILQHPNIGSEHKFDLETWWYPLVHSKTRSGSFNILHLACQGGHSETLAYLLQRYDFDVNEVADLKVGWRAIHFACHQGHADCVRLLLELGNAADFWPDAEGSTPLCIAVQRGHEEVVKVLLQEHEKRRELEVHPEKINNESGIHKGVSSSPLLSVAPSLDLGPLHLEASSPTGISVPVIKDPFYQVDSDGWTPLIWACDKGNLNLVKLLTSSNPNLLDISDTDGWTPLMVACMEGYLEIVQFLVLTAKANINARDNNYGWSCLEFAIEHGHKSIVDFLRKFNEQQMSQNGLNQNEIQNEIF